MLDTSIALKPFARKNDSFANKQSHQILAKDSQKVYIDTKIKPKERAYLNKI